MWRVVGVRVGLPRHDMEVEGVVVKDMRFWNSASVAAHASSGACPKKTRPPSCSTSTPMLAAVT